jgi:hypothetical protein
MRSKFRSDQVSNGAVVLNRFQGSHGRVLDRVREADEIDASLVVKEQT